MIRALHSLLLLARGRRVHFALATRPADAALRARRERARKQVARHPAAALRKLGEVERRQEPAKVSVVVQGQIREACEAGQVGPDGVWEGVETQV
jgi:hypothetical protein